MDLDPGCHKSRLLHRKFPTDEFDCVDREYARLILEVRVKVRAGYHGNGSLTVAHLDYFLG